MRLWQRSDLVVGEELKVYGPVFQQYEEAKKNLISAKFIGENDNGIFIEFTFKPNVVNPFGCTNDKKYKTMINWNSIYCGHVKVIRTNGENIYAKRIRTSFVRKEVV